MRTGCYVAAVLLSVVIACGVVSGNVTSGIADEYAAAAKELALLTQKQDWSGAMENISGTLQSWERTLEWLQMLVNHEDTDDVTMALRTLRAGIGAKDQVTCMVACEQLEEAARHIHHRDAFSWANIL